MAYTLGRAIALRLCGLGQQHSWGGNVSESELKDIIFHTCKAVDASGRKIPHLHYLTDELIDSLESKGGILIWHTVGGRHIEKSGFVIGLHDTSIARNGNTVCVSVVGKTPGFRIGGNNMSLLKLIIDVAKQTDAVDALTISPVQGHHPNLVHKAYAGFQQYAAASGSRQALYILDVRQRTAEQESKTATSSGRRLPFVPGECDEYVTDANAVAAVMPGPVGTSAAGARRGSREAPIVVDNVGPGQNASSSTGAGSRRFPIVLDDDI